MASIVSGGLRIEETMLPAYSSPGPGVVHHRSRHLRVALSSADAVESGGLGLAFLPGAHVSIAISPSDPKAHLSATFSAILIQFVGTSVVDAPGGTGKSAGRTMADVVAEITLVKTEEIDRWTAEIEIPQKADCVCEWLSTDAADSDTTVALPPSVNLAEPKSVGKGKGGSIAVDYRVKFTLVHRSRFHADVVTSVPITIISKEPPMLDGGFLHEATDITTLGLQAWRTVLADNVSVGLSLGSRRSVITQVKLGVLTAQKSDHYVALWQLAVTFQGSLAEQSLGFKDVFISSHWPSVAIGRRFRRLDTPPSLAPNPELFTTVHAAAFENSPTVEETFEEGGRTTSFLVRFKGILRVPKDTIPVSSKTCDGDLEVMVIASLDHSGMEETLTSMVNMFPGDDSGKPPAYPTQGFYPLGVNSEYVGLDSASML